MAKKRQTEPVFTEADWLNSQDSRALLQHVKDKVSVRKLRLVAVACGRRLSRRFRPKLSLPALNVAERYADALASEEERMAAHSKLAKAKERGVDLFSGVRLWRNRSEALAGFAIMHVLHGDGAIQHDGGGYIAYHGANAAYYAGFHSKGTPNAAEFEAARAFGAEETAAQLQTIRDVIGNPFRPVRLAPRWLAWSDGLAPKLAQGIYEERAFDRLPILADALTDAGCNEVSILTHLRSKGPHVRGCWVVDLVLGLA